MSARWRVAACRAPTHRHPRIPSLRARKLTLGTKPMSVPRPDDSWNRGDPYERYVGRWSHAVAERFVDWLALPPSLRWLDVGCGTGALTDAIDAKCRPAQLAGRRSVRGIPGQGADPRLEGKANLRIADAMAIPLGAAQVVSSCPGWS